MRKNLALIVLLLGILSFLWVSNLNREPMGTDNQAVNLIEAINPGYTPWFTLPWQLDQQSERRLFAVQAAVGSGLVCFLGYMMSRRHRGKEKV